MSQLFAPLALRSLTLRNRILMSPMCQYSARDGVPGHWHLVHLGARAVGGAALVMVEATAVLPEGRISPADTGLWSDAHVDAFRPVAAFIRAQGAVPAIQLAHAGRKAGTDLPWLGGAPVPPGQGGWTPVAPSPLPFADGYQVPREVTPADLDRVESAFVAAVERAAAAGFQAVELHMAHGYLLHEFLSPITNRRADEYGGAAFEDRARFPLRVAAAVRAAWPADLPLLVRLSCTDWVEGGWDLESSIALCRRLRDLGVDLADCSSGGIVSDARIPAAPGFQVPFAAEIRRQAGIPTAAVGLITAPAQAEQIVATGQADAVLLGRELLRDPHWPLHAARALGAEVEWPAQYLRARP